MRHWVCDIGRGFFGYLAVVPVCYGLYWLTGKVWPRGEEDVNELLILLPQVSTVWKSAIVASAVILAPLFEEVFFRGLMQSLLRSLIRSPWAAIVVTSALFAGVHWPYVKDMPALFALAIALGYNYERCGRLGPSILMHALFNAFNIVVFLNALS